MIQRSATLAKPQFTKIRSNIRLHADSFDSRRQNYTNNRSSNLFRQWKHGLYVWPRLTFPKAPPNNWIQKSVLRLVENSSDLGKYVCTVKSEEFSLSQRLICADCMQGISGWVRHNHVIKWRSLFAFSVDDCFIFLAFTTISIHHKIIAYFYQSLFLQQQGFKEKLVTWRKISWADWIFCFAWREKPSVTVADRQVIILEASIFQRGTFMAPAL